MINRLTFLPDDFTKTSPLIKDYNPFHIDAFGSNGLFFLKGDFIVIGSKPSMGKKSFFFNLLTATLKFNKSCILLDLANSKKQSIQKMLCSYANISYHNLIIDKLNKDDLEKYETAKEKFRDNVNIFISSLETNHLDTFLNEVREYIKENRCDFIFISYLQLLQTANSLTDRYTDISLVTKKLKLFAKKHNITIIAVSTFNRNYESREDQAPRLSDLRDSGTIEDDADMVILIDGYDNKKTVEKTIYVKKAKFYHKPIFKMHFYPETSCFDFYKKVQ